MAKVLFFALAALALSQGMVTEALTCGAIALLIMYFTDEDRKKAAERERLERIGQRRFGSNSFVNQLLNDFRRYNWQDLDYDKGGVEIYNTYIKTDQKSYYYGDHNLRGLDKQGMRELAYYLRSMMSEKERITITAITDITGHDSPTYYYETPGGHLAMGGGGTYGETIIGYKLYLERTKPAPPPPKQKW